ncbi:MAG: YceD family protein [bacterium]
MEILIDDIPEEGKEIKLTASIEDLNPSGEEIRLKEPLTLKAFVKRSGDKVLIKGVIQALLRLECSRCLEEFSCHIDEPFTATFLPSRERPKESDLELESDDLDVSFYTERTIDLSALVMEQLLLAIPMNPVCTVSCRGLCPECGKNLNEGRCYCSGSKADSRWSKSRKFIDD